MRLISANVNGIRAAARRGGLDWLAAQSPDVLALQEVRATTPQFEAELAGTPFADWHVVHAPAARLGHSGTAVLSREAPTGPVIALEVDPADVPEAGREHLPDIATSGRWAQADVPTPSGPVTIVSAYMPKGAADGPVHEAKFAFLEAVAAWFARRAGGRFVVTGDVNVAYTEHDLKNAEGNVAKPGFLPTERAHLDRWFAGGDVVDVGRALHGPGPGPYTWWSWRGKAFDNDAGWRIDHHWASAALAARATGGVVDRAPSYAERISDHAPVVVDYDT